MALNDDELKAVEQILNRLAQLSSSIQSLKMDILKSNPLPPTSSLQASAQILQRNLQTVLDSLTENAGLFTRMAVHPSTNYPGRAQENVLTQLLRKKLEPDVEELVQHGRDAARVATPEGVAELQGIWLELREWTHGRIAEYVREEAGDVYTKDEREAGGGVEGVRTGLRRDLDDDDESGDDDDDDDDDGEDEDGDDDVERGGGPSGDKREAAPPQVRGLEPETLLWFATRGDFEVPRNVEYERKMGVMRGLEGVRIPPDHMQGVGPS